MHRDRPRNDRVMEKCTETDPEMPVMEKATRVSNPLENRFIGSRI